MSRRRMQIVLGFSVALLMLLLLYPYEHTVVPQARIRVVDEAGRAAPNLVAKQEWLDVTVENKQHVDYAKSDETGVVTFPRRAVRAALALRIANTIWRVMTQGVHPSIGTSAAITVYGRSEPHVWGWTGYGRNGGRWPEQIQLNHWETAISP